MTQLYYIIYNINDNQLFWSNEFGWVGTESETRFTPEEREFVRLPIEGAWAFNCEQPE